MWTDDSDSSEELPNESQVLPLVVPEYVCGLPRVTPQFGLESGAGPRKLLRLSGV